MLRDDEPDEDYKPPEYWKKVIRVGKMYQAKIPAMTDEVLSEDSDREVSLWKPIPRMFFYVLFYNYHYTKVKINVNTLR